MNTTQKDLDYAYSFCKEIAISHYENFPVASILIPSNKRKFLYNIYAFARHADDIADSDSLSIEEKIRKLNELDNELRKIESGKADNFLPDTENIFIALANTISELKIPVNEFRNLLHAFRQDSLKQSYESFDELISYSDFSANPIGHLVLFVFGYDPSVSGKIFELSDKICTALQLTNFWQDVSEDLKIQRVYIPKKVMEEFSYSGELLFSKSENENFRKVIKDLTDKTRRIFREGEEIVNLVKGRLKYELMATIEGGLEILHKIEQVNFNVLSNRVTIDNFDKVKLFGKIILK